MAAFVFAGTFLLGRFLVVLSGEAVAFVAFVAGLFAALAAARVALAADPLAAGPTRSWRTSKSSMASAIGPGSSIGRVWWPSAMHDQLAVRDGPVHRHRAAHGREHVLAGGDHQGRHLDGREEVGRASWLACPRPPSASRAGSSVREVQQVGVQVASGVAFGPAARASRAPMWPTFLLPIVTQTGLTISGSQRIAALARPKPRSARLVPYSVRSGFS